MALGGSSFPPSRNFNIFVLNSLPPSDAVRNQKKNILQDQQYYYRPSMLFGNGKNISEDLFSIVLSTIKKISPVCKPEI